MTGIEWTDETWNPTTGCDRVSPGCDNCYALTMAARLKGMGSAKYQRDGNPATSGPGFGLTMHDDVLSLPLTWRKPRRAFVNSMSDLFHKDVSDEFIARVFAVMAATPQHTYQLLTKRHGRMQSLLSRGELGAEGFPDMVEEAMAEFTHASLDVWPLPNLWLGVSVENQQWADIRIPALLDTPAAVRWLSLEPLIGPVNLGIGDPHRGHDCDDVNGHPHPPICLTCSTDDENEVEYFRREPDGGGISWVVVGGESGSGARPMRPEWVHSLRDECAEAEVPFFFKQAGAVLAREWGCSDRKGGDPDEWPEIFPREYPAVVSR
jgi:protein gp37